MPLEKLKKYYKTIATLQGISKVLEWDNLTYMPEGNSNYRGDQMAFLAGLMHKKLISNKLLSFLSEATHEHLDTDADKSMVKRLKKEVDEENKLSQELVEKLTKAQIDGYQAWVAAKKNNDFKSFAPFLENHVNLQKEKALLLYPEKNPYDVLLDHYEDGFTTDTYNKIYGAVKPHLSRIISKCKDKNTHYERILTQDWDEKKQFDFTNEVLKGLGFDFNKGRQDQSPHPFTIDNSLTDVRITTKTNKNWLPMPLFGTIHECGHAFYAANSDPMLEGTNLCGGSSYGMHESQSRLLENIIGRSKEFWKFWYPKLQDTFPLQLEPYSLCDFYKAINIVKPSLIRIEADEVTYAMHIILRFELEQDLMNDKILVSELPEVWNEKMEKLLGIVPPTDVEGVLQDVHWSEGMFGYFPTYALGNLYAAQICNTALKQHPEIPTEIENGKYSTLFGFLKENIWKHGYIYEPNELMIKCTGEPLDPVYFVSYIEKKFA